MKNVITLLFFTIISNVLLTAQELIPQEQVVYNFFMAMGDNKELNGKPELLDIASQYIAPSFLEKNLETLKKIEGLTIRCHKNKKVNIIGTENNKVSCYAWVKSGSGHKVYATKYIFNVVLEKGQYYILPKNEDFINEYDGFLTFTEKRQVSPASETLRIENKRWVNEIPLDYSLEYYQKELIRNQNYLISEYDYMTSSILLNSGLIKFDSINNEFKIENIQERNYQRLNLMIFTSVPKTETNLELVLETNIKQYKESNLRRIPEYKKGLATKVYKLSFDLTDPFVLSGQKKDITIKYNYKNDLLKSPFFIKAYVIGDQKSKEKASTKVAFDTDGDGEVSDEEMIRSLFSAQRKKFRRKIQELAELMDNYSGISVIAQGVNSKIIYPNELRRGLHVNIKSEKDAGIIVIHYRSGTQPKFEIKCESESNDAIHTSELIVDGSEDYSGLMHSLSKIIDLGEISLTTSMVNLSEAVCGPYFDLRMCSNQKAMENSLGYIVFNLDKE